MPQQRWNFLSALRAAQETGAQAPRDVRPHFRADSKSFIDSSKGPARAVKALAA